MSTFQGLPAALREFFADLAQDNSKDFWDANRRRWQRDVKAPMSALVDELSNEFGPLRMFRPNRDLPAAEERTARLVDRPPPHQLSQMERGGSRSGLAHRHLDAHSPSARQDSRHLGRRRASQGMAQRARLAAQPLTGEQLTDARWRVGPGDLTTP